MKIILLMALVCLSGCSWFGFRKHPVPPPTEFIVTGAPANSIIFVDGSPAAPENADNDHPQVVAVAPGAHTVEIHVGDRTVYREQTELAGGEHRIIRVLSGLSR